ncbi:DUF7146 domain-containing protein [Rhodobaculum claviforme]|uniref:Toprim domain-containing protein n=1 Tax=Rhodobaculum claviforme TaxID=1549854 RepID=A0A934WIA0_9RHOB|nr:toprim domain-containing protein [Rhodobaculum claviforme]MBK5927990.1 hypothetical protein [Rhodobaculum claviforme]
MTDARTLAEMLGGRWSGRSGNAPCPVCQPERRRDQAALSVTDGDGGKLVLHCFKMRCSFGDILDAAGIGRGDYTPPDPAEIAQREAERLAVAQRKADQALRLWREAQPIEGTLAARYLYKARGIPLERLPAVLRFHPECWHGATARRWPAMVAAVQGAGFPAVHRSYLRPDGLGKAPVNPPKAMLGAVAGGAVRLADGPGPLLVGEGIESTLAAWALHGDVTARAWAALSTSGLRGLRLPPQPAQLCIAPDNDAPGMAAAHALAERAHALGWAVIIAQPPKGQDWNDILVAEVAK